MDNEIIEEVEEKVVDPDKKYKRIKRIINIFFILILVLTISITIDVVRVAKYDLKPLFALKTKTYKDGGTTEYTGIFYKVIDYKQLQGRRDIVIGTWSMKYNNKPITLQDIDLTIELENDVEKTYKKYYKKFVRVISTLKKVDTKNNKLILEYKDEDGKYSMDIVCNLVKEQKDIKKLETNKQITVIGTINNYKAKTDKNNKKIYIKDCIAEQ